MPILTSEELLNRVKQYVGEDTSDTALSFVQDITETVKATSTETEKYKKMYEDNDAMWRQRYRDAFFSDKRTGKSRLAARRRGRIEEQASYVLQFAENIFVNRLGVRRS